MLPFLVLYTKKEPLILKGLASFKSTATSLKRTFILIIALGIK